MAGAVNTEGMNLQQPTAKTSKLAEVIVRFKRRLSRPKAETIQQPAAPVKEVPQIPAGSGYASLIERFKGDTNFDSAHIAQALNDEYPDLLSTINSDTGSQDVKQILLNGVNAGNAEVIAIVAARLAARLNKMAGLQKDLRKDPNFKNKQLQADYLAKKTAEYFIGEQVTRDENNRPDNIKQAWARRAYFEAIEAPNWKPQILPTPIPAGIEASLKDVTLNPAQSQNPIPTLPPK